MANVKGLTISLDMDTAGVSKSYKQLNKDISATGKQIAAFSKGIKLDPKNLDSWIGKQTALKTKLTETNQKLNNLKAEKKALEATNDGSDKWKNNMKSVETEIQATTNTVGLLEKQISSLESEMKKIALSQTGLGKIASGFELAGNKAVEYGNKLKYVSLASAGILAGIAKLGISFNDAFSGVEKTVDESYVGEYEKLKNSILEMSKEMPKSVETLSQAMELGGQLGIDNSNLETFTKTMVNLEVATNMTTEEASTMAAQFANITKMNQKD
ncbi:phage tail tape measure protein, partial [Erysipelotrichaceae bacterium OttesenSCG-928-M19]|nr:phage tail tape measure protein [Erysipelotrichaceae bacterium OttesenSCG-928-M19]